MTFQGKVYWVDGSNTDVISTWDSESGVIRRVVVTDSRLPAMPVSGGSLRDNLGQFGSFELLGDGRVASSLGTSLAEAVMVFNSSLDPASVEYWTDEAEPNDRHGHSSRMYPNVFNSAYDPVLNALWMPRPRNNDSLSGDTDTWTAYRATDGTILSSEARGLGAWDFVQETDSFTSAQYSRCFLSGRMLYRTDSDGFIDRYEIGGGTWEITSIFASTPNIFITAAGVMRDGTLIFVYSNGLTDALEFRAFDSIDWVPISASNATIAAATPLGDLTPSRTWAVPDHAFGGGAASAPIQIIDDVAYYFRRAATYGTDFASEFVAHDLVTDTVEVVFTAPEQYLTIDGSPTTSDDPDYWYDIFDPGWGLAVVPGVSAPQQAPPGRRSPRPYGRRYPPQEARQRSGRRAGGYY